MATELTAALAPAAVAVEELTALHHDLLEISGGARTRCRRGLLCAGMREIVLQQYRHEQGMDASGLMLLGLAVLNDLARKC